MTFRYEILLSLQMLHNYYASNVSSDFEFYPTATTLDVLQQNGLRFLQRPEGFKIAFRAADTERTPFFSLEESIALVFGYRLKNPALLAITDVADRGRGEVFYSEAINSETGEATLTPVPRKLAPQAFSNSFTNARETLNLAIQSSAGKQVHFQSLTGGFVKATESGEDDYYEYVHQVNLQQLEAGNYTIKKLAGASLLESTTLYCDNELAALPPFGVVRIELAPESINYLEETAYTMQWYAIEQVWEYRFVLGQSFDGYLMEVEDQLPGSVDPGAYPAEVTFATEVDTGTSLAKGTEHVFTSNEALPYHELPRKYLRFSLSTDVSERVIAHLPNPSLQQPSPIIYINV